MSLTAPAQCCLLRPALHAAGPHGGTSPALCRGALGKGGGQLAPQAALSVLVMFCLGLEGCGGLNRTSAGGRAAPGRCLHLSDPFSPEYMSPGIRAVPESASLCAALTVLCVYLACADGENG